MKFLCDRCKTRYSIADERVRGKILKIRCKNCANVITVREGMEEAPAEVMGPGSGPVASRSQRASFAGAAAPAAGRPLEAAFATAMSSPGISVPPAPAALEEEWYVSIDGTQSGPFSLAQAQAWVAGRAPGDELYCWCEGFDDWLPVEKVSHFRGVRGRSRPRTEPPPIPSQDSGRHLRPHAGGEPQPLFAATLAALESDGATQISAPPIGLDDVMPKPGSNPIDGRNGRGAGAMHAPAPVAGNGRAPAPSVGARGAMPIKPATTPGAFGKATTPAPTPANGTNGHDAPARSLFDVGGQTRDDGLPDAMSAGAARGTVDEPSADDLDIGEVSRVVRIADLGKVAPRRTPVPMATARGTGGVPKLEQAALALDGLAPPAMLGATPGVELARPPPPPKSHTVLLAAGVGIVALIATLVIVFAVQSGGDEDDGLGPTLDEGEDLISNVSVDVQVVALPKPQAPTPTPTPTPGTGGNGPRPGTIRPRPPISSGTPEIEPDRSGLTALSVDEVDAMSRRMSTGPRRCYEQATKKDPFLEVKTIKAVITIDRSGMVSKVELLNRANDQLDGCLASAIKRWKFRENSEGLATQISFVFASS